MPHINNDPRAEYLEHFSKLSAKGEWSMQTHGATDRGVALVSPGVFARQNLLCLESIVLYHNTPPGFSVRRKNYRSYQLVYTLSGKGQLQYMGKTYRMGAGDCFLIDCLHEHYYFTEGEEDWVHHGIQFKGHQMPAIFEYLTQMNAVVVSLPDGQEINAIHERLAATALSNLASADIIVNQLMTDLISRILLCNQLTSQKQLSPKVREICNYIDENYAVIGSIDDIARSCFISKYYMCREFKLQTGKTVGTYLLERRLNVAKALLNTTEMPVCDVAKSAGFQTENNFFGVFKAAEGLTPLKYRKQFKQI